MINAADFIRHDKLNVGDGHSLYLAQYGNPEGLPILYLHGGPGAGSYLEELELFDLTQFRVLLLDQRGSGNSYPQGELTQNNLKQLLNDIEKVRQWLGISRWFLAGGSFGATLGMLYSGLYPQCVIAQVYWGMFIPSQAGTEWLYGPRGAARFFPSQYADFVHGIAEHGDVDNLFEAYYHGMNHRDPLVKEGFVRRWLTWESALALPDERLPKPEVDERGEVLARMELHFARHHYFNAYEILCTLAPNIIADTHILQGEQDWVCYFDLLRDNQARFDATRVHSELVRGGYHSLVGTKMLRAVIRALDSMASKYNSKDEF